MQTENEQRSSFKITEASPADLSRLETFADSFRHNEDKDYYIRQFEYQAEGKRIILLACEEGNLTGYCVVNFEPRYALFKKLEIPEIQDVVVHPNYRRRGVGKTLIAEAESLVQIRGSEYIGIGVSVGPSFGPAQQLYVRLGYIPDGNGVSYDRKQVAHGEFRPVDNELCLMMIKPLNV